MRPTHQYRGGVESLDGPPLYLTTLGQPLGCSACGGRCEAAMGSSLGCCLAGDSGWIAPKTRMPDAVAAGAIGGVAAISAMAWILGMDSAMQSAFPAFVAGAIAGVVGIEIKNRIQTGTLLPTMS